MKFFKDLTFNFVSLNQFNKELSNQIDSKNEAKKLDFFTSPKTQFLAQKFKHQCVGVLYANFIHAFDKNETTLLKPLIDLGVDVNRDPNTIINRAIFKVANNPEESETIFKTLCDIGFNINQTFEFTEVSQNNFLCKMMNVIRPPHQIKYNVINFDYFKTSSLDEYGYYSLFKIVLAQTPHNQIYSDKLVNFVAEAIKTRSLTVVADILNLGFSKEYIEQGVKEAAYLNAFPESAKEDLFNLITSFEEKKSFEMFLLDPKEKELKRKRKTKI